MRSSLATAAAVAIVAAAGFGAWIGPRLGGGGLAFADVRQEVGRVKNMTYKCITLAGNNPPQTVEFMYRSSGQARKVHPGGQISVFDYAANKTMMLWPKEKRADIYPIAFAAGWAMRDANVVDMIQKARDGSEEVLGERMLDGQKTVCFEIHGEGIFDLKVWADPKTELPVRVELIGRDDWDAIKIVMKDFRYNVELDDSLFSLTPPEGYSVQPNAPMFAGGLAPPTPKASSRPTEGNRSTESDAHDEDESD